MKKILSYSLGCIVAILLIQASCEQTKEPGKEPVKADKLRMLDGRSLFEQFVFFEGDVAKEIKFIGEVRKFAKLDELNKDQQAAWKNYKSYVLKYIEKYRPSFFREYGAMMHSGNPLLVEKAMGEAADLLICAMALKPLLVLKNEQVFEATLSDEERKILNQLTAAKNMDEFRTRFDELKAGDQLWNDLFVDHAVNVNLNLNDAKDFAYFKHLDVNLYRQIDFYINRSWDLDKNVNKFIDHARFKDLNINRVVDVNTRLDIQNARMRFFDEAMNYDVDFGAGAWFYENEYVSHNDYVNYNRAVNVETAVNVAVAVNIAVAVNVVVPKRGDNIKRGLMEEELVRGVTERLQVVEVMEGIDAQQWR